MLSINYVDRQGGGGSKMSISIYKGEGGSISLVKKRKKIFL